MIYEALVLENEQFFSKGKIRVRIADFYNLPMQWDLSGSVKQIAEGTTKDSHKDFDVYVFSPIGGGYDFGAFFLPSVNTRGLVCCIGSENNYKMFWLGSIFYPIYDQDKKMIDINIPSDDTGGFEEDKTADMIKKYQGSLVFKMYNTELTNKNNPNADKLNWSKLNASNLLVINKDKVLIHHPTRYDSQRNELDYQEIKVSKEATELSMVVKSNKDTIAKNYSISMSNKENNLEIAIKAENVAGKKLSSITMTDSIINISTFINSKEMSSIVMDKDGITLSKEDKAIVLSKDNISINAEKSPIFVIGKEVRLGQNNVRILTTTQSGSFTTQNGMVIQASNTIFG